MKKLNELTGSVDILGLTGDDRIEVTGITADSRKVEDGFIFVAVRGTVSDGHLYIDKAIASGARVIVCEHRGETQPGITYVLTADTNKARGLLSSAFYGEPSRELKLIGITGTNGKTTTATLLFDLFTRLGYQCGLISTVENRIGKNVIPATHTTPEPVALNCLLAEMVASGCDYCFMEVSSHSVSQERIAGLHFTGAVFTNLTHDHLDYHGTFPEYLRAKKGFFDRLDRDAFALINTDDRNGRVMVQNTKAVVRTYSLRSPADYGARIIEMHFDGTLLRLDGEEIWLRFTGRFNAYNLLAVYGAARELGADKEEVLAVMSGLTPVAGRFETVTSPNGITAIVDYAHTPDALQNVISTIDDIRSGGARLITVAGCGGDRDRTKRPEMGRIAAEGSDMAILTSDNPRTEDPGEILKEMRQGVDPKYKYLVISDRREAIRAAAAYSCPGDIILIAGKGHETYQEIQGVRHHFDDREEIGKAFQELCR